MSTAPLVSPSSAYANIPASQLLYEIFKRAAWGIHEVENLRVCEAALAEAAHRSHQEKGLYQRAETAYRQGKAAYELWQEAEGRLKRNGENEAFHAWFDPILQERGARIAKHLTRKLERWRAFTKPTAKRQERSTLPPLRLKPGQAHPNHLAHLTPAAHWQVVIDETGSEFGLESETLNLTDSQLGKVVALAVPTTTGIKKKLPPLPQGFHATDHKYDTKRLDDIVARVLRAPVGVLGVTVRDQMLGAPYSWLSAIHLLMRWTLRQLPLCEEHTTVVEFLIEARSNNQNQDISYIAELLESEARRIDPLRFGKLKIKAAFIGKQDSPLNGYVDTIAYCWGSPSLASKERLKSSGWLGHCLLRPTDQELSRLLLATDNGAVLPPEDWLTLARGLRELPDSHLIHRLFDRLAEHVRTEPAIWQRYVNEASLKLQLKQWSMADMEPALSWLENTTPVGNNFPATLQLQLRSVQLALQNHRGASNLHLIGECLELGDALLDEAAPLVTEAYLRIAVAATNVYDFDTAAQVLNHLQPLDVKAMGLLNKGKLLSSLGQLAAFQGDAEPALRLFQQASDLFGRLSSMPQRLREQQQTDLYALVAATDSLSCSPPSLEKRINQQLTKAIGKPAPQALRSLAYSDNQHQWLHHVVLRALCLRPELPNQWRSSYLQQAHAWQQGNDHPWPLILFYRGWLLLNEATLPENTPRPENLFTQAIELCRLSENGPTLHWMAEVLAAAARLLLQGQRSQGLTPDLATAKKLHSSNPCLPIEALNRLSQQKDAGMLNTLLDQTLPFNFH